MPRLPRPPQRRAARSRADAIARPPEPDTAGADVVEAEGLRWINIERPQQADRAWLEEHFDFHPLDYEDVYSRNQRPKVDEYDGYLFVVLHFPVYDKRVNRLNAAEVDIFVRLMRNQPFARAWMRAVIAPVRDVSTVPTVPVAMLNHAFGVSAPVTVVTATK